MKSSQFRARSQATPEARTLGAANRINWDRVFYLSLLAVICTALGWHVAHDIFYVETPGRIVTERFDVRFASDVQILDYTTAPGETIRPGTPLFQYVIADDVEQSVRRQVSLSTDREADREADRLQLEERITLTLIERDKKQRVYAEAVDHVERVRRRVYMDLATARELNEAERQQQALAADVEALTRKAQALQAQQQHLGLRYSEAPTDGPEVPAQTYRASVHGTIGDIYWQPSETVLAAERVLSILLEDNDLVYIRAVFSQLDAEDLREGDVVRIHHANGQESLGRIRRLAIPEIDTAGKPFEIEPEAFILAEVDPLTIEDRETWVRLQTTQLVVTKWRF